MAQAPTRNVNCFFIGAGVGSAFGIPNTQELLEEVHTLADSPHSWASTKKLATTLQTAYGYFYPIEKRRDSGFRPNVVDFFSILTTFSKISEGLPGKLEGTRELLTDLRRALANVLVNKQREADNDLKKRQPELDRLLAPGNMIVTSNWDCLLERYAHLHDIPLRHSIGSKPSEEVTLIKLHGSIDWCLRKSALRKRRAIGKDEFSTIRERLFGPRPYQIKPIASDHILRIRALEHWSQAWSRVKSRSTEPLMITMAMGKTTELMDLLSTWRHAYRAISRANQLEIVGYSLPNDDIEIRTLLIAGLERKGGGEISVTVRNPSPEVHDRFRKSIRRSFDSNYRPVASG